MAEIGPVAAETWLEALATHLGAQLSKGAAGWELTGESEGWRSFVEELKGDEERAGSARRETEAVTVAAEPSSADEWRDRLRVVERSAARSLTATPVGFTAVSARTPPTSRGVVVARLAFGFSLSLGRRNRQRFTAYAFLDDGGSSWRRGDDGLLGTAAGLSPLDPNRRDLGRTLPALSAAVVEAEASYRQDSAVCEEVRRIRGIYEGEVRCLERLYMANWGQDAPLLGEPAKGLRGDDAVEAEYVTRLEDLVDRYRPRVLFEPLTLGVLEGWDRDCFVQR